MADEKHEAITSTLGFSPVTAPVTIKKPFKRFQFGRRMITGLKPGVNVIASRYLPEDS